MELQNKSVKSQYVLVIAEGETYKAIQIPDSKVSAVDKTISSGKSIKIGGKFVELNKIVGIFTIAEWSNLRDVFFSTPQTAWGEFKRDMAVFKLTGKHPKAKENRPSKWAAVLTSE